MKLRKGDQVVVIAGKDRGKKGTIEAVLPGQNRVVVGGVNILKKSVKASANVKQAGLVEFPAPLAASNVMAVDPKSGKPTRIGYRLSGTGRKRTKIRVAKASGQELTQEVTS
jgi:large subunit ribosomal protein L24